MEYPKTERKDVVEKLHGKEITDHYQWLENINDKEVKDWLKKQHKYTDRILSKIPNREKARKRIKEIMSLGVITTPKKKNDNLFYQKRTTENQPILFMEKPSGETIEIINPNELSKKEPTALDWFYLSPNCKYIVYGLSKSGDEWSILHIKEIESGKILSDRIPRTRHSSIAWLKDETGFYYTRFPEPGSVKEGQENYNQHVYFHKIGTNWKQDPKIFGEGRHPQNHYSVKLSDDDRYLLITILKYTKNDLYLIDLKNDNKLIEIISGDESLSFATFTADDIWILTNKNNPRRAIYKAKVSEPHYSKWELIVPETERIIDTVVITEKKVLVKAMVNASDHIFKYSKKGELKGRLELPDYSTIGYFGSSKISYEKGNELYFILYNFFSLSDLYQYTIKTNEIKLLKSIESPIKSKDYIVKQVWYESKDKTKVSMFIVHKNNLKLNGKNPTFLAGYGGFKIALKPPYLKSSRIYWLEKGGIIAIANLRGGSEFGEEWHQNGMLDKKQNVFDDFIAAAEWLIENKYASKETLGIYGRSNGGLLTGAAITQRPELFNAVYIGVPLLDMIRYHKFKIARYWIPEYGSSENPDQFDFILAYSPYHNVKKNVEYPATFLVTAASDTRVDANHAMKMTALLQWANKSKEPILLFVEEKAGHGVGKPLDKLVETETDIYTFIGWKTGLEI